MTRAVEAMVLGALRARVGERAEAYAAIVARAAALMGIERLPRARALAVLASLVAGVVAADGRARGAPLGELELAHGWRACVAWGDG